MRLIRETVAKLSIAGELIVFLWKRKLWWLIPMVAVLLAFGIVIVVGGSTGAGPVRVHAVLAGREIHRRGSIRRLPHGDPSPRCPL